MKKDIDYIVVDELPEPIKGSLKEFLKGKTLPSVKNQRGICCYKSDYENFLKKNNLNELKVKFFKGWITPQITSSECNETWYDEAVKADKEKYELIVFKIPKNETQLVSDIERMLQQKLK